MLKKAKWFTILIPTFYFLISTILILREDISFTNLKFIELIVNGTLITVPVIFLIKKAIVNNIYTLVVLTVFIVYLFSLNHLVTFIPISYYLNPEYLVGHPTIQYNMLNLVPFQTISETLVRNISFLAPVTLIQIMGNLLMLTPLAFALMSLSILKSKKKDYYGYNACLYWD